MAAAAAAAVLAAASPLTAQSPDSRLQRAEEQLRAARDREQVLTDDIARYGETIRVLEGRLGPLRDRSTRLEAELSGLRARLDALDQRLTAERARLARAQAALVERRAVLSRRLREIYVRGVPDPVLVLVESGSLAAAVQTVDLLGGIADHDAALAGSVARFADETRRKRDAIRTIRAEVARSESRVAAAVTEAREARAQIEERQSQLERTLAERRSLLERAMGSRLELEQETRGLRARSERLGERIRAAQHPAADPAYAARPAAPPPAPSGFGWPVSGTLTSSFGPRWGRMHEGLDIAGPSGTPIRASASGTVIVAGWSGGYGNLVVVDHGGGMSTAYAHNSRLAVSVGQRVGQGAVIAGMGTTGNSTGVHSHFEIRVNGSAVDPAQYL